MNVCVKNPMSREKTTHKHNQASVQDIKKNINMTKSTIENLYIISSSSGSRQSSRRFESVSGSGGGSWPSSFGGSSSSSPESFGESQCDVEALELEGRLDGGGDHC